jgi:hypothetical protein
MIDEARRINDAARERGIVLRLFGGLAVREHCDLLYFCERDYSDIDLIGLKRQYRQVPDLFATLGFRENLHVRLATDSRQLQFYRECDHPDADLHYFIHPDDHVDVFLDAFRMDHDISLADRLEIEDYTISLTDVLLTKLQVANMDDKDERDIVSLLAGVPLGESDTRGTVNVAHIAHLCAAEWGLYHDVLAGIVHVRERLGGVQLDGERRERVAMALDRLERAVEAEPKSTAWKLRARVGTRVAWHNVVEEQDAGEHGRPLDEQADTAGSERTE